MTMNYIFPPVYTIIVRLCDLTKLSPWFTQFYQVLWAAEEISCNVDQKKLLSDPFK